MSLRALLQPGDEVLLPSPDYPLWSAATILNGGRPRYYHCLASNNHLPDPDEVEALITPRTRALVLINPNNPDRRGLSARTAASGWWRIAARHRLLLLSDEIYDEILYDGATFQPLAEVAGEVPCLSFGGLSKVHRACGYRVGWMSLSGAPARTADYRDALQLLAALRLCANVTAQWAIVPALQSRATIGALTAPGGRLHEARAGGAARAWRPASIWSWSIPDGALYAFPQVRADRFARFDDEAFALRLLEEESVLVVPGSSFNVPRSRHFRLTLLPPPAQLREVFARIERVLARMAQRSSWPSAATRGGLRSRNSTCRPSGHDGAAPPLHYLALGDSYTIGEAVPGTGSLAGGAGAAAARARRARSTTHGSSPSPAGPPTNWRAAWTQPTLASGVRPGHPADRRQQPVPRAIRRRIPRAVRRLLDRAIGLAGDRARRVVVVSIPDWGVTRFAREQRPRPRADRPRELDAFNAIARDEARPAGRALCRHHRHLPRSIPDWWPPTACTPRPRSTRSGSRRSAAGGAALDPASLTRRLNRQRGNAAATLFAILP